MANPPVYQHSPGLAKPAPAPQPKAPVKVPKGTNTAPTGPSQKPVQKTGQAGLFGGQGPTAYINSLYAPQEQANAQQQGDRLKAYQGLVSDYLNSLKDVGSQLQPYQNAASQQTADASNAAAGLAAANPNASVQAMLNAIGAPQAQKDQLTAQNQTVFNGGGALLNYTGGVIPSDQFKSDAASRASYLAGLPAIGESLGIRGLSGLNAMSSKENSDLATQKATALQKANTDLASYVQGNQKLKLQAQKNAFNEAATSTRLNQGQQRLDLSAQMDAFNQKYKISTYNLSVTRLNQSASKFAYQQWKDNRAYKLQLQKFGLQTAAAQRAAIAQEYKLKNNGFTPLQVNKFKASAFNISNNAFNGIPASASKSGKAIPAVDYKTAVREMRSAGVPLSIAIPELNQLYAPGVRGRPLVNNGTTSFDFGSNPITGGNAFPPSKTGGGFLPSGAKYVQGRADQGRDFQTDPGGPIIAPGAGYVIAVKSDPRGFGPAYPIVHFTSGTYAGQDVYVGHTISALQPGAKFASGSVISHTGRTPLGNASVPGWAEIGFAPGGMPGQFGQQTPFGN